MQAKDVLACLLQTDIEPQFILFFDCSEEVMERRLLGRNQVQSFMFFQMKSLILFSMFTSDR